MKIHFDNSYKEISEKHYNPILRTGLNLNGNFPSALVSKVRQSFTFVENAEEADCCILPMMWNYYIENDLILQARSIYNEASSTGKKLVIFSAGDYTANIPIKDVIIIEYSSYKSRNDKNGQRILTRPVFIEDYLTLYADGKLNIREKQDIPIVGFCGQANGSILDFFRRNLAIRFKKILFALKIHKWEPPVIEPTRFRNHILKNLMKNKLLKTNFILRNKYRAGHTQPEKDQFHPTRLEFIQNILSSDYTVCMRGGRNFSARLYETLALGRIPIFVNTDCILPFEEQIDYRGFCIWVEEHEIRKIGEIIRKFHTEITTDEFEALQRKCRQIWLDYFTKEGFYSHLECQLRDLLHP